MVFRRMLYIKELPASCTTCPLFPMECSLSLENGYLKDGLDARRDDLCSLIVITQTDIDFFLNHAKKNRENSQALSEMPTQKWKEQHKAEVELMDGIIERLENIQRAFQVDSLRAYIPV